MKRFFLILVLGLCACRIFAEGLTILPEDTILTKNPNGGYDLYIRKTAEISSVLITESTQDTNNEVANYAYRAREYNPINGDELRMLNGQFLTDKNLYSLIDSTPEYYEGFGFAFRIWIPEVLEFGYETGRNGLVIVQDGLFLNIRTFEKPYADYSGKFCENPFLIRIVK